MGRGKCDFRIGTSGWHYKHWIERFYPRGMPTNQWLEFYSRHFDTVEINNTFYNLPSAETVKNWHDTVASDFLYAVKANRYITHIKRLKAEPQPLERFFERADLLREKLGPVLYQLSPNFKKDLERLAAFCELLPKDRIGVFEFRHQSWFSEDCYRLLEKYGCGFCIHDLETVPTPRVIIAGLIYIRFHGSTGRYQGSYPESKLKDWAQWMKQNARRVRGVYAYFNNDYNAYAIRNAMQLKEMPSG